MRALLTVIVGLGLLAVATPARAGCTEVETVESGLASADLVVVGLVQAIGDGGRSASVVVDEVWKGDPGGTEIEVNGGSGPISSTDRVYILGSRYLVFAQDAPGGGWTDSVCSPTQVWDDGLAGFRPTAEPTAEAPTTTAGFTGTTRAGGISPATRDGGLSPGVVTAGLSAVVIVSIGSLLFRRRPQPG